MRRARTLRRLRNLNWIATVLTPLAVVLMEVYWFYPWLVWTSRLDVLSSPRAPLSLGAVVFLVGGSFVVTRYLLGRQWPMGWVQFGVIACGLAVVFTVLRSEYHAGYALLDGRWFAHTGRVLLDFSRLDPLMLALPAGAYLWWRGISRGRVTLYPRDIYRTFVIGTASLVLLIIVWRVSLGPGSLEALASAVAPDVAAFFFFALAAMALTNLHDIQRRTGPEETVRAFNRRWLPVLLAVVGGIVLFAVGIAALFSPEFLAFLSRLLNSVFDVVRQVIYYILIPFGYIAAGLVWLGTWLISLIRSGRPVEFQVPDFLAGEEEETEIPQGEPLPEALITALKWLLFAIAAAAVIYLLVKAIGRFRASREASDAEEFSESLFSWQGLKADILLFLSSIWRRLWRRKSTAEAPAPQRLRQPLDEEPEGMGVRQIYRRLLWQASRFGIRHRLHETPFEYSGRLGSAIPEGAEQLAQLTGMYVAVRYGDIEAGERQVAQANGLWQRLKGLLQRPERRQPGARPGGRRWQTAQRGD